MLLKMLSIECDNCNEKGNELFMHYSGIGPYCESCLDIVLSDDGIPLSAYKFESIIDLV